MHSVCKRDDRCDGVAQTKRKEQYKLLYFVEESIRGLGGRIEFQNQVHHIHHNRHERCDSAKSIA